jgi:hypothetical protein
VLISEGNRTLRTLHEKLDTLHSSPNIISILKTRMIKGKWECNMYGGGRVDTHTKCKRGTGRLGSRCEDTIKMDLNNEIQRV